SRGACHSCSTVRFSQLRTRISSSVKRGRGEARKSNPSTQNLPTAGGSTRLSSREEPTLRASVGPSPLSTAPGLRRRQSPPSVISTP
ncbi:hypothetical protein CMEL01_16768, partial [Colletotrichum melonis]